jgi:hypothetical protein
MFSSRAKTPCIHVHIQVIHGTHIRYIQELPGAVHVYTSSSPHPRPHPLSASLPSCPSKPFLALGIITYTERKLGNYPGR